VMPLQPHNELQQGGNRYYRIRGNESIPSSMMGLAFASSGQTT
jgi:hypothetical protein